MPSNVFPRLVARFKMADGEPSFINESGLRHYKVKLEVENVPTGVYAVIFELHPTYYDPIRTVPVDTTRRATLEITAYGDYDLKTTLLSTKEGRQLLPQDSLLDALRRGHASEIGQPAILQALNDIAEK